MNRSIRTTAVTLLTAVAAFAATSAFADGDVPSYPQALTVGKSRVEVRAEFDQARAAGLLIVNESSVAAPAAGKTGMASTTSRDDVKQALRQAIASGEVNAQTAEPQGFAAVTPAAARKAAQTAAARG